MLAATETLACPVGQTDDVVVFLEIPGVPVLCNVLSATPEEARAVPRGDLRLGFSPASGHVYNYAFDPALLAYSQAYENSLHFSPRFQAEMTPRTVPNTVDMTSASPMSNSVHGSFWINASHTGMPSLIDVPKSPVKMLVR